jgi:hypothetical protein
LAETIDGIRQIAMPLAGGGNQAEGITISVIPSPTVVVREDPRPPSVPDLIGNEIARQALVRPHRHRDRCRCSDRGLQAAFALARA